MDLSKSTCKEVELEIFKLLDFVVGRSGTPISFHQLNPILIYFYNLEPYTNLVLIEKFNKLQLKKEILMNKLRGE